jgi:hypothetical protein
VAIFISYARQDRQAVLVLRADLGHFRRETWMDGELDGGQDWWDEILDNIRACEAFLFVVSPDSVTSRACRAELDYAQQLHRPLLPVMVRETDLQMAADVIAETQVVDLQVRTMESGIALSNALALLHAPPELPSPLPDPPPAPVIHLGRIHDRIDVASLPEEEQWALLNDLRGYLSVSEDRPGAIELLRLLHDHGKVAKAVADDIDRLLADPSLGPVDQVRDENVRWSELVDMIQIGQCTPVLGFGLTDSLLGSTPQIAMEWAGSAFPLAEHRRRDWPSVAQYISVEVGRVELLRRLGEYVRHKVAERFSGQVPDLGPARLDEMLTMAWQLDSNGATADPHDVLAHLPLPIYVTAHPSNLLAKALEAAGKEPVVELCRWRPDGKWPPSIKKIDRTYEPSEKRPLVFHLFGHLEYPDSLVMTEDDYFDYLINVSQNPKLIPTFVQGKLADSALLFLGFHIEEWDFRVLLRSLLSPDGGGRRVMYPHLAAQIDLTGSVLSPEGARAYLAKYFQEFRDASIAVFWGTVDQFAARLQAERDAPR